jgi:hypothetical protein
MVESRTVGSSAFFTTESDDVWGSTRTRSVLNTGLIDAIAKEPHVDEAETLVSVGKQKI